LVQQAVKSMRPFSTSSARFVGARALGVGLALSSALGLSLATPEARACGGFFCGQRPVDQTAERILFEVGQDSVTMTTQISYEGDAADFAWVLPLSTVPDVKSLSVFPQKALNALDSNSGPQFNPPNDPACYGRLYAEGVASAPAAQDTGTADNASPPPVTVYVRAEVGPFDVAVVGSTDPGELVSWLRTAGYRITDPMVPYITQYTSEGMKFLALKLQQSADVKDIEPFRFTLPGSAPSIPLRMTALAAEPEMSILVFVLADQRYEGKNWPNLDIADDQIRYNPFNYSYPVQTNWASLVAQAADKAGGQGWATEFAGPSDAYAEQVNQQLTAGNFATPEDKDAAQQLSQVLQAHPYMTRLYTRLSAEEMGSDPVFGASALGDVSRQHQLSRVVNGVDQCAQNMQTSTDPCDFSTCGAAGLCRPVAAPGSNPMLSTDGSTTGSGIAQVAACACLPGATARATLAPDVSPTTICQDGRLSFLNPGDRDDAGSDALPDPCATFSCGDHGQCIAMNLTPTCVCDQGYVAVGAYDQGSLAITCVQPPTAVPVAFYQKTLAALPDGLPGGRDVPITTPEPMPEPGQTTEPAPIPNGFPMPRSNPSLTTSAHGGCAVAAPSTGSQSWLWLAVGAAAACVRRRRPQA
jgi:MYXO-CTERM domain-containing protein